jgi:SAM-dependent methyltransferase
MNTARDRLFQRIESQRERFQSARADVFVRLLQPTRRWSVLDLGGNRGQFGKKVRAVAPIDLTVADILDFSEECDSEGIDFVQLTEGERLPFADGAFDVVISNSVIEHVTLPKEECLRTDLSEAYWKARSASAQAWFAKEISRVCHGYFVQTPHKHFPIDLHLWLPLTNWMPHRAVNRLIRYTDRFWIKQVGIADWNLLGTEDMRRLFPDCRIHVEKVWGLPKSIIAYKRPEA